MASIVAASTAPRSTWMSPLGEITAKAGWEAMPYSAKTSPSGSETCGKVSPNSSTNDWNEASSPYQATPTRLARPAHRALASSTEGASLRQVNQPGAQNQRASGLSARVEMSRVPPPTSGTARPGAVLAALASVDPGATLAPGSVAGPVVATPAATVLPGPAAAPESAGSAAQPADPTRTAAASTNRGTSRGRNDEVARDDMSTPYAGRGALA